MGKHPDFDVYARIYYFRLNSVTTRILSRAASHLYAWRGSELPTDLCLMRPDGEAWLVNIAVDEESYVQITVEEAGDLSRLLPDLRLRRMYTEH